MHICSLMNCHQSVLFLLHRFLLQSLEDLDNSLRKLNSRLFVVRGQPTDVFPRLFKVSLNMPSVPWSVSPIVFHFF